MARTPIDEDAREPSHAVGPGRPPEQHRIRDGEIRNPWGRRGKPKAPVDFLDEWVVICVDGEPRQLTRGEALDYFLFAKAAKGDVRAMRLLEDRKRQRQGQIVDEESTALSPEDQASFDRFVERRVGRRNSEGPA